MRQVETDVLIIGGGITAAMVAEKLTEERDVEVLIVEAGGESAPLPQRGERRRRFLDYGENPWTNDHIDDQSAEGIMSRSMVVGGQALHWGGVVPRFSPEDLRLQSILGVHTDWPIDPADVNGDGKTDLIASRGHAKGAIWFEAPDWQIHDINSTIQEPHSLTVADLDADGDIDVATCAFGSKQAAWFENDGSGQFETHILDENQEAYDIRAVDLDADTDLDLLVAGRGSKNVVWYRNPLK